MHNPLAILHVVVLDGLVQAGHRYFVRQSYPRGMQAGVKESLLISHYRSAADAKAHYDAILTDKRRYIYNMDDPADKEKLYHAAGSPEGYLVYVALLKVRKWKPDPMLAGAIRRYMRLHAGRPEGRESLSASLFIMYGELFITFKRNKDDLKIPLSEIEKT